MTRVVHNGTVQFQVVPYNNFSFCTPMEWHKRKRCFKRFGSALEQDTKSEEAQVNMLLYCMGPETDIIWTHSALNLTRKNIVYVRAKFFKCRQAGGETANAFINNFFRLAEMCELHPLKEELITMVNDVDLNVEKSIRHIRHAEMGKNQQKTVRQTKMLPV
ncbi:hypothetical protein PR048_014425 [Dryococelus australis]|uniref:Uncharacterized protein n=1 Tax=Dryococelus australis TaxID=614101 RepID=A0ABQ9HE88_9NEOP|nr:hypothetical protein PR048_014425 [Dryococelus australis]